MMKKFVFILMTGLLLTACTGVKSLSTGLEDESFLEFVGNPDKYDDGVVVTVDNNNTFTAKVKKDHANRPKGEVYAISKGKHLVAVSYNGQVVYQKQIFVSAQETKKIILP